MRKNHHGKKDRLVKRVFALCLALAVICTCLVPVFATEYKEVVDSGEEEIAGFGGDEAAYPDGNEAAGFGGDFPAVDDGEPREVYDDSETTSSSESSSGNYTVEEKDDALVYVLNPDPSSSTGTDPVTQWSGEDDVVEKPDDKVVVSGDEIKKLQDMVVYRFWLKELNANDLQDITAQAQINNMTESEYLARNGEVLWNLYFIQAVPRAETIADYSSYIENPSSNRDPKGELRLFDYWYTLDEFGNRVRLNLTDPTSNILDDKTTTVNVYAAWKDGTVGSDEEEDVDHEDLVDKNPVPVDLETKASASYEDEDGNTKSVNLPVEVKNLPSAAHSLSVIHMGDNSMTKFCDTYKSELQGMEPLLGLKISPKNAKGQTVQPANGEKATVTVSGLNELPEIAAMDEVGALTADALKVLHLKNDGTVETVETLDVASYKNGTLTFETNSFSPFVIAAKSGYEIGTLANQSVEVGKTTVEVGRTTTIQGEGANYHSWIVGTTGNSTENEYVQLTNTSSQTVTIKGLKAGDKIIITHWYKYNRYGNWKKENYTIKVTGDSQQTGNYVPLYIYGLRAGLKWSANNVGATESIKNWYGLGIAKVNTETYAYALQSAVEGKITDDTILFEAFSASDYTYTDGSKSISNLNYTGKALFPVIDGHTYWDGKVPEPTGKYYTVEWLELKQSNGATKGGNNYNMPELNDGGLVTYHLDVRVNFSDELKVDFKVIEPGDNDFTLLDPIIYRNIVDRGAYEKNIVRPENQSGDNKYSTAEKDGYTFDGWYRDPDFKTKAEFDNTQITTDEVFYGHWVKNTSTLTVSKTVTGKLGDTNKAFTFTVRPVDSSKTLTITDADIIAKSNDNVTFNTTNNTFTLAHGDYITLSLPVGSYVVEETAVDNYTTKYKIGSADEVPGNSAEVALGDTNQTLAFINHCGLKPDTGVLLDTLPYIVILAVVAGGVALLMLRKHRKEDD